MLIRIRVENFLSFKDEIELSMVASPERIHPHHVFRTPSRKDPNLLRLAALYGPNASGKSNLVKAFTFLQQLVTRGVKPEAPILIDRFRLDPDCLQKPAVFEIEFRVKDTNYIYTVEVDPQRVYQESLTITTANTSTLLFSRTTSPEERVHVEFGPVFKKRSEKDQQFLEFLARGTRPNQLFLRETIDRNLPDFRPAYNWFSRSLKIVDPDTPYYPLEIRLDEDQDFKAFLCRSLKAAGTGISEIEIEAKKLDEVPELSRDLVSKLQEEIDEHTRITVGMGKSRLTFAKRGGNLHALKLTTAHVGQDESPPVAFELNEESDGTRRLLDLLPLFYEGMHNSMERVVVVDEIDRSLHPHLTRMLVRLHLDPDYASTPSQLLLTTHETHLLDLDLLRRDEIWFTEKRRDGSTDLYALSDFQPRYDKEIRRDYLIGRYGAIPFIGDARHLRLKPAEESPDETPEMEAVHGASAL